MPMLKRWMCCRLVWIYTSVVVGSIGLAFFLYGQTTKAQWGMIDDHEIVHFLGSDRAMHVREFWPRLMETEVGSPGKFPRYRPAYYSLRLIETILWGDSVKLWYTARLVIAAVVFALTWLALIRWIGFGHGLLVMVWTFTYPYWADIFCRLGPSETYASLGLAICVYGVVQIAAPHQPSFARAAIMWILVCLGVSIAAGSKENFLVIVPVVWVVGAVMWRRYKCRWFVIGGAAIVTSLSMLIVGAVIMAISRTGHDVYSGKVSLTDRLMLFGIGRYGLVRSCYWYMKRWQVIGCMICACAVLGVIIRRRTLPSYVFHAGVMSMGLVLFYAMQYFFYSGGVPSGVRYDFPAMVVVPMFWATAGWMLGMAGDDLGGRAVGGCVRLCMSVVIATVVAMSGAACAIRQSAERTVHDTSRFVAQVTNVASILRASRGVPLTLLAAGSLDYEKVYSVERFLRYYGVTNDIYVEVAARMSGRMSRSLDAELAHELECLSESGKDGVFMPIASRPGVWYTLALSSNVAERASSLGRLE